ncbi:hypothetical protein P8452_03049 [Trifolium repens]|nr:hypothetical protein P8452_03049 [Trifolium repens]
MLHTFLVFSSNHCLPQSLLFPDNVFTAKQKHSQSLLLFCFRFSPNFGTSLRNLIPKKKRFAIERVQFE